MWNEEDNKRNEAFWEYVPNTVSHTTQLQARTKLTQQKQRIFFFFVIKKITISSIGLKIG